MQAYKSVKFDWRERKTAAEKRQLELLAAFMQTKPVLADTNGARETVCMDAVEVSDL
ncbi:MAG: hypothetical protein HC935_02655 [Pseudanabaena sp. SU_2_4]|nr:hypothetical protein [Pseudanabaena sp. SU_2_4]